MKKNWTIILVIAALLGVTYGVTAVEKSRDEGKEPVISRAESSVQRGHWAKDLDLTREQKESMQKIHLKYAKDLIPVEARIKDLEIDMNSLLMSKVVDEQKLMDVIEQIGKNKIIQQQKHASEKLACMKILTEDQQEKLRDSLPCNRGNCGQLRQHKMEKANTKRCD